MFVYLVYLLQEIFAFSLSIWEYLPPIRHEEVCNLADKRLLYRS